MEERNPVKVVDAPMGFGKTTAMIRLINEDKSDKRYMFVTPYLSEIERVKKNCTTRKFLTPEAMKNKKNEYKPLSKLVSLKNMLRKKKNIATTHALFGKFDEETVQLISDGGYTLVMDEVASVVFKYDISPYDAKMINTKYCGRDDDGRLFWLNDERFYYGVLDERKKMCDAGCLWYYNDTSIVRMMPKIAFDAFDDIYILTYMFHCQLQRYYFDMFGIPFEYRYVEGNSPEEFRVTDRPLKYVIPEAREKIHICYDKKMNFIGEDKFALGKGWYERNAKTDIGKRLASNAYNFLRNRNDAHTSDVLFTSFIGENGKPMVSPQGYAKGFIPCNIRATNEYRERAVLAYLVNRFFPPEVSGFFAKRGIKVDADGWALSEMLQWIWRGAIRDGGEIYIYIPSRRMRELLEDWVERVSEGGVGVGE